MVTPNTLAQNQINDENLQYLIPQWLADKSPLKQHMAGVSSNSVICQGDLHLVIKNDRDSPACVRSNTANGLHERGWAANTTSSIYAILEQDYHNTEYKNGTKVDSYDIDVKTDITNMSAMLEFDVFLTNGMSYKSDSVPIRDITASDEYYRYHVDIASYENSGNQASKIVISYNNDSTTVYMPPAINSQDVFGISEIYPTKNKGMQWYMNTDYVTNDTLFYTSPDPDKNCNDPSICTLLYKNPDGDSWHVKRMDVPENEGIRMVVNSPPNTLWLNTEMTGYYRILNSTHYPQEITHVTRSGSPHTSICHGYSYYSSVTYDGNIAEIQKSLYHAGDAASYSETFTASGITTPLNDRWFGMKTIVYNVNSTAVKLEIWIDDQDNNTWHKAFEHTDTGWPVPGNPAKYGCKNIATGQIMENNDTITWGGTEQQFRADNAEMDFKNLSIREIEPPIQ